MKQEVKKFNGKDYVFKTSIDINLFSTDIFLNSERVGHHSGGAKSYREWIADKVFPSFQYQLNFFGK